MKLEQVQIQTMEQQEPDPIEMHAREAFLLELARDIVETYGEIDA